MTSVPQTKPPPGFKPWWLSPPSQHGVEWVVLWRRGSMSGEGRRALRASHGFHPAFNVHGLWWKEATTSCLQSATRYESAS